MSQIALINFKIIDQARYFSIHFILYSKIGNWRRCEHYFLKLDDDDAASIVSYKFIFQFIVTLSSCDKRLRLRQGNL